MNIAGYDHDEPMIYGKLAIEAHDAKIRAEALKDAGERAKKWMLAPEPGCSLLTAILAGEVKE